MNDSFPDELFAGLGSGGRAERERLLSWLVERGIEMEELRRAAREGRLALLPTELVLTRDCRYSLPEAAAMAGVEPEFVRRAWRAAGIAVPGDEEPVVDDDDLEAIRLAKQVLDAGLPEEAYVDISRVVGRGSAPTAEALVQVSIERFLEAADSEEAFAMSLEEIAERLTPLLPSLLAFPVRMHLREAVRHHALERRGGGIGELSGTRQLAVGFADLVGFTALSEELPLADSSRLAAKLEDLAAAVVQPPVRIIKLIGDAAMLVSDEPRALVGALKELDHAAQQEDGFPSLRMGAASGELATRAGDVYGPAVNLASRLADVAEPSQLLVSQDLADELGDDVERRVHAVRNIKGIGPLRPVEITAARS